MKIKLGQLVRDTITGYQGIATGRFEYLAGCVRVEVSPQKCNPETRLPVDQLLFDESLLVIVGDGLYKPSKKDTIQHEKSVSDKTTKIIGGPRLNKMVIQNRRIL